MKIISVQKFTPISNFEHRTCVYWHDVTRIPIYWIAFIFIGNRFTIRFIEDGHVGIGHSSKQYEWNNRLINKNWGRMAVTKPSSRIFFVQEFSEDSM